MEGLLCHYHHHNYPNSKDYTCGCNDLLFNEGQMTKAVFHHLQVYIIAMSSSKLFQLSVDSS